MSREETWYIVLMTIMITVEDVQQVVGDEVHLKVVEVRPSRWGVVAHWVKNAIADGILWIAVLLTASGVGLLLEAIYDTMRWGHPR